MNAYHAAVERVYCVLAMLQCCDRDQHSEIRYVTVGDTYYNGLPGTDLYLAFRYVYIPLRSPRFIEDALREVVFSTQIAKQRGTYTIRAASSPNTSLVPLSLYSVLYKFEKVGPSHKQLPIAAMSNRASCPISSHRGRTNPLPRLCIRGVTNRGRIRISPVDRRRRNNLPLTGNASRAVELCLRWLTNTYTVFISPCTATVSHNRHLWYLIQHNGCQDRPYSTCRIETYSQTYVCTVPEYRLMHSVSDETIRQERFQDDLSRLEQQRSRALFAAVSPVSPADSWGLTSLFAQSSVASRAASCAFPTDHIDLAHGQGDELCRTRAGSF